MRASFFNDRMDKGDTMKLIKRNIIPLFCIAILAFVFFHIEEISDKISVALEKNPVVVAEAANGYQKKDDFIFVQNTSDFVPLSYNDILNIYYTITNNGYKTFTFYCPSEYKDCTKDVEQISDDPETLTYINNFIHPYNSFSNIKTIISESGEINITINYLYTEEEITTINQKVDEIIKATITNDLSDYDKIKTIHDYIVDHTKYDVERNNDENSNYISYKAYGPLIEGYATCSGYTDAMALFLDKFGIKNFKVATELMQEDISGHVWNAVLLDGKWLHLDLTWDDPVSDDGKDYLQHKYFLITSDELLKADAGEVVVKEHIFSTRIYPELKNNA